MSILNKKITPDEILLFFLLLFGPLAHGLVESWSITTAQVIVISLVTIAVLSRIYQGELKLYRTPADIPIILFLICLVVSYSLSVYSYPGRLVIYKFLSALALFFYIINTQRSREKINRLLWVIVILGTVYAVMGLTLVGGDIFGFKIYSQKHYNISLFYVNHNHFAGYLELVFCLALGLATANRGGKRIVLFSVTVLIAAALLFSLSRGGIVGGVGGLAFLVIALAFIHRRKKGYVFFVSASLLGLIIIAWLGLGPVLDRLSTLEDISVAGEARIRLWEDALRMIFDRPFFGWGPGTFTVAYPVYQTYGFEQKFVNYAHNDYLELAADTGVLGLAAFIGGLLSLYISCLRRLVRELARGSAYWQNVGVGALAACFAILIHSVTDCNLQISANLLLFVIAAGIAVIAADHNIGKKDALWGDIKVKSLLLKSALLFSSCLAACASIVIVLLPFFGERYAEAAKAALSEKKYDLAMSEIDRALFSNPDNAEFLCRKGDILLTERVETDTLQDIKNCTQCEDILFWYKKAGDTAPTNSSSFIKKALFFERYQKSAEAEKAYREAIRLAPMYAWSYYRLGVLYIRQRKMEDAVKYFRHFLEVGGTKGLNKVLDDLWSAGGDYGMQKQVVPETALFRQAFARYLTAAGEYELAAQEAAFAFSLEPAEQNAWAHLNLLWRNKDFAGSLRAGEEYVLKFPDDLRIQERYAATLEKLKQYDEAVSVYRQLIEDFSGKGDNAAKYFIRIAGLYAQQKLYTEAIETFQQGIKKYPRTGELYFRMGLTCRRMKKNKEALEALKKAVSLNPDNVGFRYHLGEEYRRNKLEQEALSEWKECLVIKSDFARCGAGIEQIQKKFGLSGAGQ